MFGRRTATVGAAHGLAVRAEVRVLDRSKERRNPEHVQRSVSAPSSQKAAPTTHELGPFAVKGGKDEGI